MEVTTNSAKETKEFGKKFSKSLKPGDVICLFGDLGTGKTTFVQGLAFGLGIKKRILSPSFFTMREYNKLIHMDFYHQTGEDIKGLDTEEVFNSGKIVVIEWANKIKRFLPKKRIDIFFEFLGEQKRKIKIVRVYD